MRFKKIAFWTIGISFAVATTLAGTIVKNKDQDRKAHKHTTSLKKINIPQPPTIRIDSVEVTDSLFTKLMTSKAAGGQFLPKQNIIQAYWRYTHSNDPKIISWCKRQQDQLPITLRHEQEHARKAFLVKNTYGYSPYTRARIAIHNETMAPASEIIEAMDIKYKTGAAPMSMKQFLLDACAEIMTALRTNNLNWPVNFNNQAVADIVLKKSIENFHQSFARGYYHTCIQNGMYKQPTRLNLPPGTTSTPWTLFMPEQDIWDALWQFDSAAGPVNIWRAASDNARQEFLKRTDIIINQACPTYILQPNNFVAKTR